MARLRSEHNFHRGGSLAVYDDEARAAAVHVADEVDQALAMEIWQLALSSRWPRPGVWVHGDIAEGNLLVKDGRLSAVIDFGSSGVGDPSSDLILAWNVLDTESRAVFRHALNLDDATWQRGRGWALWKALIVLAAERVATDGRMVAPDHSGGVCGSLPVRLNRQRRRAITYESVYLPSR